MFPRAATADEQVAADRRTSSVHVEVVAGDGGGDSDSAGVALRDRSTNGTFVNSKRMKKGSTVPLTHGDLVTFVTPVMDHVDPGLTFVGFTYEAPGGVRAAAAAAAAAGTSTCVHFSEDDADAAVQQYDAEVAAHVAAADDNVKALQDCDVGLRLGSLTERCPLSWSLTTVDTAVLRKVYMKNFDSTYFFDHEPFQYGGTRRPQVGDCVFVVDRTYLLKQVSIKHLVDPDELQAAARLNRNRLYFVSRVTEVLTRIDEVMLAVGLTVPIHWCHSPPFASVRMTHIPLTLHLMEAMRAGSLNASFLLVSLRQWPCARFGFSRLILLGSAHGDAGVHAANAVVAAPVWLVPAGSQNSSENASVGVDPRPKFAGVCPQGAWPAV